MSDERRQFLRVWSSAPPPPAWHRGPTTEEIFALMREESILPIATEEVLPEGAVLVRWEPHGVPGAVRCWVVYFNDWLPEPTLLDAVCLCVQEFLRVADADEGGPMHG